MVESAYNPRLQGSLIGDLEKELLWRSDSLSKQEVVINFGDLAPFSETLEHYWSHGLTSGQVARFETCC